MRLLSVVTAPGASAYYRQVLPTETLRRAGHDATWKLFKDVTDADALRADVIVLGRAGGTDVDQAIQSTRQLQALGKAVVLDYDDLITAIPAWNPAHLDDAEPTIRLMRAASGLTVTNATLASELRAFNPNVAVFDNYIDPTIWPLPTRAPDGTVTIGIAGTPSHARDWELIAEPMRQIRRDYPATSFVVAGFLPDYLRDVATEHVEWVPMPEYPALLRRFDIGLCPLLDDRFNRCKSPIKAYEYALSGAAVVASPTKYASVVRGKGKIARTEAEWYDAIRHYITNPTARHGDTLALRAFVARTMDARNHARDIYKAYSDIHKRTKA